MAGVSAFEPSPSSFTSLPPAVEETHISVVVLVGDRVFKLKKPIELPFLDWRSREARLDMCHREVELNRRICPDVYLGVADVLGGDGAPCGHLVVMRRMPDERRLSRLLRERADLLAPLDDLARLVASFHASAERSAATVEAASRDAVGRNWDDNLATLHAFEGNTLDADVVAARRCPRARPSRWSWRVVRRARPERACRRRPRRPGATRPPMSRARR